MRRRGGALSGGLTSTGGSGPLRPHPLTEQPITEAPLIPLVPSCVSAVLCSFRGSVAQALVLDLGETVHILEKCEGEDLDQNWTYSREQNQELSQELARA